MTEYETPEYYTKLLKRLPASSIWDQGDDVLRLWILLLCTMDEAGVVTSTKAALGRTALLPPDRLEAALEVLLAVDPESTSQEAEGRRLQVIGQNKWLVTTAQKVRTGARSDSDVSARVRRHRARKAAAAPEDGEGQGGTGVTCNMTGGDNVTCNENRTEQNITEESTSAAPPRARARFTPPSVEEVAEYCRAKGYTEVDSERFWAYYQSKGWTVGKSPMKDWRAAIQTWRRSCVDKRPGVAVSSRGGESARDRAERFAREEAERMKAADAEREAWKQGGSS